jgi:hypothetical protein
MNGVYYETSTDIIRPHTAIHQGCKTAPTSTYGSAVAPNQLPCGIGRVEPQLALVIGNSRYQHNPLKNPINDATDVRNVLKNMGFKVSLETNLTQRALDDAIYEWVQFVS